MGIALGAGIILGVQAAVGQAWIPWILICISLAAASVRSDRQVRLILIAGVAGCVIGLVAGLQRVPEIIPPLATTPSSPFEAVIVSDPKVSANGYYATLRWRETDGQERESLAFLAPSTQLHRGATLLVDGQVDGLYGERIDVESYRVTATASGLEAARREMRKTIEGNMLRYVPGSPASLALGLVIGDDSGLTGDERENLRRSGLAHITAVSGSNVILVAGIVGGLLLAIGARGWRWMLGQFVALALFVWLVGPEPPVVRAAIMCAIALFAIQLGRPVHAYTTLMLAAAIMVTISPEILHSVSFQLSAAATLALIVAARYTVALGGARAVIITPIAVSAAAGLATAPLLAANFGMVSLMTVPANVLAAPFIPVATIASIVLIVLSAFPEVAPYGGWVVWAAGSMILQLSNLFARSPIGIWTIGPPPAWVTATIYLVLLGLVALLAPEGRFARRRMDEWWQLDPASVMVAGASLVVTFSAAALVFAW